jgi:hypothetical protein
MKIIKNGNISYVFRSFISLTGVLIIGASAFFIEQKNLKIFFCFLGLIIGSFGSYCAQAAILKLKPFTNDPLGWREMKKSYEKTEKEQKIETGKKEPIEK